MRLGHGASRSPARGRCRRPAGVAAAADEALEDPLAAVGSGSPGPRSSTTSTAEPSVARVDTVTGVPGGVCETAFSIRLRHEAVKVVGHAVHRHGRWGTSSGERRGPRPAGRPRWSASAATTERSTGSRGALAPGVGAGEQQEVRHQPAHPVRGAQRGAGHLPALAVQLGLEQLEVGEDAGQRRAQLVRGVGHEVALALERGLALAARGAQLREHVLEGVGEVRRPRRSPRGFGSLTSGSRVRAISRRRTGEPGDRAHRAAGHVQPAERTPARCRRAPRRRGRSAPG